jgi:lactoylglutathione lyase
MRIDHIAIFTQDLEKMKNFYEKYFNAIAGQIYINPKTQFHSYFLTFEKGGRLELMFRPDIPDSLNDIYKQFSGLIHFAISVGSEEKVNAMTEQFRADGFEILDGPRWTGDGYYESVVLDCEKNRIEITI